MGLTFKDIITPFTGKDAQRTPLGAHDVLLHVSTPSLLDTPIPTNNESGVSEGVQNVLAHVSKLIVTTIFGDPSVLVPGTTPQEVRLQDLLPKHGVFICDLTPLKTSGITPAGGLPGVFGEWTYRRTPTVA